MRVPLKDVSEYEKRIEIILTYLYSSTNVNVIWQILDQYSYSNYASSKSGN